MKILVCGGREFDDSVFLNAALDALHARRAVTVVVHGGARGADELAGRWARCVGVQELVFEASWASYAEGRAGFVRNQRMLDTARPELTVVFPGGRGTADMAARAQRARVRVWWPKRAACLAL